MPSRHNKNRYIQLPLTEFEAKRLEQEADQDDSNNSYFNNPFSYQAMQPSPFPPYYPGANGNGTWSVKALLVLILVILITAWTVLKKGTVCSGSDCGVLPLNPLESIVSVCASTDGSITVTTSCSCTTITDSTVSPSSVTSGSSPLTEAAVRTTDYSESWSERDNSWSTITTGRAAWEMPVTGAWLMNPLTTSHYKPAHSYTTSSSTQSLFDYLTSFFGDIGVSLTASNKSADSDMWGWTSKIEEGTFFTTEANTFYSFESTNQMSDPSSMDTFTTEAPPQSE